MKKLKKIACVTAALLAGFSAVSLSACAKNNDKIVLRVANWEEYIDLGEWEQDELIEIDNPYSPDAGGVIGVKSMIDEFTEWFNSQNDYEIAVEYSTFGDNEDLYNRLTLGDKFDLICPSDYLIMKLIAEDAVLKYSNQFFDSTDPENYYVNFVSPYIDSVFEQNSWREYAACYMWGTTGLVYNPDYVTTQDVSSWSMLQNRSFNRRVTIKDNVRDSYFAALGIAHEDKLLEENITSEARDGLLNDVSEQSISKAEAILKDIKENVYSFETDSGKADMITGKVIANYQWSGDAVFIMDEAESDETKQTELWYSVPDGCTNLWFDGWLMLKDGIGGDQKKKAAAEAFVNYLSRPDNAVRNMNYIGYTSAIAGDLVFDYLDYNYGAALDADGEDFDESLTELYSYDVSYFFGEEKALYIPADCVELPREGYKSAVEKAGKEYGNERDYTVYSDGEINRGRQAFAQYPPQNVISRAVIMRDFGDKLEDINQMWIHVRCLDLLDFNPAIVWTTVAVGVILIAALLLYRFRYAISEFIYNRKNKDK